MSEAKTHWKALTDPRYIGAYALPGGQDLVVMIERVGREQVTVDGGRKEDHLVMHLRGHKPMILNATNSKSIQRLYGPYIEDWPGKQITLYASTARLGGDVVECLRIRPSVPAQRKPIAPDRFARALEQVQAGAYPAAKLRAGFELTPEQAAQLDALEPAA